MTGLVQQPVVDGHWPNTEESPYVDWWRAVETTSMSRDVRGFRSQSFRARDDGRGFEPTGVADRSRKRTLPMWGWSLAAAAEANDRPTQIKVPDESFDDPPTSAESRPPAVLVVIDSAINPLHERFRDEDGRARIKAIWMMEGRFDATGRVPFGCEPRAADLHWALMAHRTEETALRALGSHTLELPFSPRDTAQLAAHGTHVLDLAGGTDPEDRGPDARAMREVPVLAVSLPSNRLMSPSGTFLEVFVDQALAWAETRLDQLYGSGSWPPVVLNLSYGLSAGPKDGSGFLARRIRALLAARPTLRVTMPAGNDGKAGGHATLRDEEGRAEVTWVVMPSDPFSAYAEVWTTGDALGTGLRLVAPGGDTLAVRDLAEMKEGIALELVRPDDGSGERTRRRVARLYPLEDGAGGGRRGVLLCVAPTRRLGPGAAVAPAGLWTIGLTRNGAGHGHLPLRADVHLQSERPLTPGSLAGHPSRLARLGCVAPTRVGTLNAVAIGSGALIVDAVRRSDGGRVDWSSLGDVTYHPPFWADGAEVAERSRARPGLLTAGYRSGTKATVQGTSFASAVAAHAALRLILGLDAASS